jgi:two-component system sensor histidine kinase RegB
LAAHTPAIIYGLGNFIENASDFAKTRAIVEAGWTKDTVEICIVDDGPGFSSEVVDKIGEPYVTSRANRRTKAAEGWGLGLGVFIAKTLLERTGAEIRFSNSETGGASIRLKWERARFEAQAD